MPMKSPFLVMQAISAGITICTYQVASYHVGILYRDMYTSNLVGAHVEMQSLEVLLFFLEPPV